MERYVTILAGGFLLAAFVFPTYALILDERTGDSGKMQPCQNVDPLYAEAVTATARDHQWPPVKMMSFLFNQAYQESLPAGFSSCAHLGLTLTGDKEFTLRYLLALDNDTPETYPEMKPVVQFLFREVHKPGEDQEERVVASDIQPLDLEGADKAWKVLRIVEYYDKEGKLEDKVWIAGVVAVTGKDIVLSAMASDIESSYQAAKPRLAPETKTLVEYLQHDLEIKVELDDPDGDLTPADEAELLISIHNPSKTRRLKRLKLSGRLAGPLKENEAIRFYGNKDDRPYAFDEEDEYEVLEPGGTWELRKKIRTAGERNTWIYDKLIKGAEDASKPKQELGVELAELLELKLVKILEDDSEKILFEEPVSVSVKGAKRTAMLSYPDLSTAAGLNGATAVELDYYRNGDPGWTSPGNETVRAVALRAARYGTGKGVSVSGKDDWDSPRLPDAGLEKIVQNLVDYVHQSLMPKNAPGPHRKVKDKLAPALWSGTMGPGKTSAFGSFICQEHSILLGSLLRALGLPTREINVYARPVRNWSKSYGVWGNIKASFRFNQNQDAGTQVYYNGDWHSFFLFNTRRVITTHHHIHYTHNRVYWIYDMWVGIAPWKGTGYKARFNVKRGNMVSSPAWQFYGYGDVDGFNRQSSLPTGSEWFPVIRYKWFSPLAAMVVLPDGRRVGTNQTVDVVSLEPLILNLDKWPSHIVNEVPHASYLPEGIRFYWDAADPESGPPQPQTVIVPVANAEAYREHRIIMTGTGNGPFRIEATYVDEDAEKVVGRYEGNISRGQRIELRGDQLAGSAPAAAPMADTPWAELDSLAGSASRRIGISANQNRFKIGEPLIITVEVDRDGYLNVLNLGPEDTVPIVLYPNQLHPDNRVRAGQRIRIPGPEDGFELEAQGPAGKNLLVVVHTAEPVNAYQDGAGNPGDLFKTLSSTRGFSVKAKSKRRELGVGKIVVTVE